MAESYHIDHEKRMVWTRCWGVLTDADLLNHQARLKADPEFQPSYGQLVDTTEVTEVTLTAKTVQQVAQSSIFAPESRRAILVIKDILFGLGRMFQLYQSIKGGISIHVFRERAKAIEWLEVMDVSRVKK